MEPNAFSPTWYATYLEAIPRDRTEAEVAFVGRHLPMATYPRLLDLCCGTGRHAAELARNGYAVLGVDTNTAALASARATAPPGARFEVRDMRQLSSIGQRFDGVINLWQSFGYFDDETNAVVLRQMRDVLRPGGRAIVDLYNRDHFAALPASETSVWNGRRVDTTRSWIGHRLSVGLVYETGATDSFDWRLYTPVEFADLSRAAGFTMRHQCGWFSESIRPSPEHARMQFVLERG